MEITFIEAAQTYSGNESLEVFGEYGWFSHNTDFAIILGARSSKNWGNVLYEVPGCSWTISSGFISSVGYVNLGGSMDWCNPNSRDIAVRPVIPSSETSNIKDVLIGGERRPCGYILKSCLFGEFPQEVVYYKKREELETLYAKNNLLMTLKSYTFEIEGADGEYEQQNFPEYELDGKKYIRVIGNPYNDKETYLWCGENAEKGKVYWVEIQPIEWLMDGSGAWISKKNLLAGMQFDADESYEGDFSKTTMYSYLNNVFVKEIQPSFNKKEIEAVRTMLEQMNAQEISANSEKIKDINTALLVKAVSMLDFNRQNGVLIARSREIMQNHDLCTCMKKSMQVALKTKQNKSFKPGKALFFNMLYNGKTR